MTDEFRRVIDLTKYISHKIHPEAHARIIANVLRNEGFRRVQYQWGEVYLKNPPYKFDFKYNRQTRRYRIPVHWWVRIDDIMIVDYMLRVILDVNDDVFPYGPFLPSSYETSVLYAPKGNIHFAIDSKIIQKYEDGGYFDYS